MNAIRIYCPEGSTCYTRRVHFSDAQTHINARDQFAAEAELLLEFADADGIPALLGSREDGTAWRLDREDEAEGVPYARYVPATSREEAREEIDAEIVGDSVIYYDDATRRWYVGDAADLDDLAALMEDPREEVRGSAYSHWCAQSVHGDGYLREEEARAAAEGELLTYHVETDAGSDSEVAATLEQAYEQARAKITDAMIEDGATLWVESPGGDRITMDTDGSVR